MSEAKKAPEKDGEQPKKGKKKLIMIVAAALLVVAGVGGYLMFAGGSSSKSKTPAPKPSPVPGTVVALDAVTVNLAGGHYLKIKLALQLTAAGDAKTDGSHALDLAITEFTDRPMSDLSSADGRAKVKADLLEKVAKAYEDKVMDIYFTQFVMQ